MPTAPAYPEEYRRQAVDLISREKLSIADAARRLGVDRAPRACYDVDSYRRAVNKACRKAKVPVWSPNQLRHAAAAEILSKFDLDRARATLGHSEVVMTTHYARSADGKLAAEVAAGTG